MAEQVHKATGPEVTTPIKPTVFGEPGGHFRVSRKTARARARAADFHESGTLTLAIQDVKPRKPIHFPEPPTFDREGKRYTTVDQDTPIYDHYNGWRGEHGEMRRLIGRLYGQAYEGIYVKRWDNPHSKKMVPSIEVDFEKPVQLLDPRTGEITEFTGVGYGDRYGLDWEGSPTPSTQRRLREEAETRKV